MNARPSMGAFLRSRRERLTPAEVGLPDGARRRTPGLRREELATISGISVDYIVRLEQNRDRRPSASVLAALCVALRLDEDECSHLQRLAALARRTDMCPTMAHAGALSATTVALLDRLHTTPAVILERSADIAAWNQAFDALMRPTGLFDVEAPNLARYMFLAPGAQQLYRDWKTSAGALVSGLHSAAVTCARDEALDALISELLTRSPEFAKLWSHHDVSAGRRDMIRMRHPHVGPVDFDAEMLIVPGGSDRRFVTYLPADQSTAVALERLLDEPGSVARGRSLQAV
jgi:transcriptional regulator with XRE-family HTH domain